VQWEIYNTKISGSHISIMGCEGPVRGLEGLCLAGVTPGSSLLRMTLACRCPSGRRAVGEVAVAMASLAEGAREISVTIEH